MRFASVATRRGLYQALVRRQEHRDAGVDLADGEGNEHAGLCRKLGLGDDSSQRSRR